MSIAIKTPDEINKMRVAGKLAADVLEMIAPFVKIGTTTEALNQICHDYIVNEQDAIPAPLNYHGFPKSICTSINHVICHGIPNDKDTFYKEVERPAVLKDGDIINIDITVIKDGFHGDTSKMFLVGDVSDLNKRLCLVAQESLYRAIKKVKPGMQVGEIGCIIQKYIKNTTPKFSIVKDYCGHGIGASFHEDPQIMHYKNNDKTVLKPGMTFTIEPMINVGKFNAQLDSDDNWTVYTADAKNSAQWEHTLLITDTGCEVLTLREEEDLPRIIKPA